MARDVASFRRPPSRFRPQPVVLVICEDSKSSLTYLNDVSYYFRVKIKVEITHCGKTDPRGIVEEALRREGEFDRVYCVIDRDSHPKFDEALNLARTSSKVEVVASYPCYEFWLLLHFGYSRKPYAVTGQKSAADCVIEDLRKKPGMGQYDKSAEKSIFESLLSRFEAARTHAANVLAAAKADGEMNPSTAIHLLVDYLEELSEPQTVVE